MWSKPQLEGDGPAPREGHSAALIGHVLFIFGGCGKTSDESEEIYFNDLYMLDTGMYYTLRQCLVQHKIILVHRLMILLQVSLCARCRSLLDCKRILGNS